MSFGGKLVVSYLTKIRVEFINQVTDCKLRKSRLIATRNLVASEKSRTFAPSFRDTTHTGFSEWQELINHH